MNVCIDALRELDDASTPDLHGRRNLKWWLIYPGEFQVSQCTYATSALAQDLLREKIYRRFSSRIAYKRDKTLLAFRGKCRRSRSRRVHNKQLNILHDVVSEEIVSFSWDIYRTSRDPVRAQIAVCDNNCGNLVQLKCQY